MGFKRRITGRSLADAPPSRKTVPWGVEVAAAVLCKRWKPGIVWLLLDGAERFGEIASRLPGVSAKVLTQQLRELERDHLVHRRAASIRGRFVVYELTAIGMRLGQFLAQLEMWGASYHEAVPGAAARHGLSDLIHHATRRADHRSMHNDARSMGKHDDADNDSGPSGRQRELTGQ
jgi:DNA-binding HxlR family transcriptional regulator